MDAIKMKTGKLEVRATSAPWHRGIEFLVMQGDYVAEPLVMKAMTVCVSDPTFTLDKDKAQTLMDDLWQAGLRPTEGSGSAGALAATQRHLEDMRTLVFKK
jgi:hypothetical protein